MKRHFILVIFTLFLLKTIVSIKAGTKSYFIPNFSPSINKHVEQIRNLQDMNDTESPEPIYDTSIVDSTYIEIVPPTVTPLPDIIQPTSTNSSKQVLIYGYDKFKPEIQKKRVGWDTYFVFSIDFYFIPALIRYYISVFVSYHVKYPFFRALQEDSEEGYYIEKLVTCEYKGSSDNPSHGMHQYSCNAEFKDEEFKENSSIDNISKIEVIPELKMNIYETKDSTPEIITPENVIENPTNTEESMTNKTNIVTQVVKKDYLSLKLINYVIDYISTDRNNRKFTIHLIDTEQETTRRLKDEENLYNFTFVNEAKKNQTEKYICELIKTREKPELECTNITIPFKVTIQFVEGFNTKDPNSRMIIKKINKNSTEDENNIVDLNIRNSNFYKRSSSGLSGGAIAGIVIVCIVAVVVISLLILMLRKKVIAPVGNESTIEAIDTNNISA